MKRQRSGSVRHFQNNIGPNGSGGGNFLKVPAQPLLRHGNMNSPSLNPFSDAVSEGNEESEDISSILTESECGDERDEAEM